MYYYHFHQWLSFFYFYCIFGWCFESTYVSLAKRKLINRGFMKGPWLPLYGTGAIAVLFVTLPFQSDWRLVYLVGALTATILEYIVGVLMVALFKVRYWDYSYRKIQFQGHICLVSSIAWGFLSLLMVYVVHEPVATFILSLNNDLVYVITFILTVIIVFDFTNSFRRAMDLRNLIIQAKKLKTQLSDCMELQRELVKSNVEEKWVILNARMDYMQEHWTGQFADKANELSAILNDQKLQTDEQLARFEEFTEKQINDMKDKVEIIRQKMLPPAGHMLMNNPGAKMIGLKKETKILKKRLKKKNQMNS